MEKKFAEDFFNDIADFTSEKSDSEIHVSKERSTKA